MTDMMLAADKEAFDYNSSLVDLTSCEINVAGGKIKLWIIKPKNLPASGNACEIHAHGGGAVMGDAS